MRAIDILADYPQNASMEKIDFIKSHIIRGRLS
jgi:hypothetical protein